MIDPQARTRPYLKLLLLAAFLGAVTALITFAFVAIVHILTDLVWVDGATALGSPAPLFTLLVCTLGGLVMVQQETAPVVAIAVVSGALLSASLALMRSRRGDQAGPADPAGGAASAEASGGAS